METNTDKGGNAKPEALDQDKKIGYSKFWGAIAGFVILSWPPFYGYMYLHGYLTGLGYGNTHVSLDIQEAVWFFAAGMSGIWSNLGWVAERFFGIAMLAGVFTFILLLLDLLIPDTLKVQFKDKTNSIKRTNWYEGAKGRVVSSTLISALTGGFVFLTTYVLPILLLIVLSVLFGFLVIGNLIGINSAEEDLGSESCIYAKPDSNCTLVSINEKDVSGFSAYSNEKVTFFITEKGRFLLNDKGRVIQFKPFVVDTFKKLGKEKFVKKIWAENIDARRDMLNDFISKNKESIYSYQVLEFLGESDSKFHYNEFPAYKLSTKSTCSVGFPYDWKTERIVNVVLFGDCKGSKK